MTWQLQDVVDGVHFEKAALVVEGTFCNYRNEEACPH